MKIGNRQNFETISGYSSLYIDDFLFHETGCLLCSIGPDECISPDEAHFAFATRSTTNWWLVYDGKDQPEQYFSIKGMQWRPRSSTLAYTACSEKKRCRLYVDGKASGPEYEGIYSLKYSKDGSHFAYMAYHNDAWYAVLDGKETGPGMDSIDGRHWGFSRTGHFYVAACHGHKTQTGNIYINNE